MITTRRASCRAFSLVETIAAMVLCAIAVPPVLWALAGAANNRADPILMSRARWLATEKLEDIVADRHSSTRGWAYIAAANYAAENSITDFAGFARSVAITETGASLSGTGTGYRTVTVTVTWKSPRHGSQSLAVGTVLTDYTP